MKKDILILSLILSLSFSGIVSIPEGKANHFIVGACLGKVINAYVQNKSDAFLLKSAIFIGKELTDTTGFSLEDLAYEYLGDGIVTWELKF